MLKYIIGIPLFGLTYMVAYYLFIAIVFFLGDTGPNPPVAVQLPVTVIYFVLRFPFGYFVYVNHPFVNWLQKPISHEGIIDWADFLNAIFWGAVITWTIGFLRRRRKQPEA